jgi:hypothetical protein
MNGMKKTTQKVERFEVPAGRVTWLNGTRGGVVEEVSLLHQECSIRCDDGRETSVFAFDLDCNKA